MTETVQIKSPIDGSIYAERPVATDQAVNAAVERAKAAQAEWAATPIAERGTICAGMLEALVAMNDEIVPELAWQMGRPVRYGGEYGGVEERTRYMVEIAEDGAGAGRGQRQGRLPPLREEGSARRGHGHRAVELSLPHRGQHDRAGADGRQRRDPEACRADAAGRRALRRGLREGRPAEGRVPEHRPEPRPDREAARLRQDRPCQFHRLGGRRPRHREGRGRHLHDARAGTRRQGPGLCAARRQARPCGRQSRRRRLLQFRPVLLRHRARLCAREGL